MGDRLQKAAMALTDRYMQMLTRKTPDRSALENCKIVSHRGEHDNVDVFENTLPAFDIARKNGVWGIECDIRWTADLVPVICHDPDGARVFGNKLCIADLGFDELRERLPLIPSLEEVLAAYGGHMHLMLELKDEPVRCKDHQKQELRRLLDTLEPGRDFHILALDVDLFDLTDFLPESACLPVAELNVRKMSGICVQRGYGGMTGHYLLLNKRLQLRHESVGQPIGTGFVASKHCLFRELNRGVEWIFSNDAVKLQRIRDEYLTRYY